ncbi:hypothetical protein [Chrysiogenes arsenatis]|uniref:hypothetical protein n=1 Tax=Chrysiogenes arsenatis TaxID=309797 RepID=UPI00041A5B64|nr:hypothetical protein [Chrysiogenes arsenatis]
MQNNGSLSLHFEGEIVVDHMVSARTLGKSLVHTQNAIDRAYLDLKYGNLWKYARMRGEDYPFADFVALYPEEGGFVQRLLSDAGKQIVNRISSALTPAMERVLAEGEEVAYSMSQQVESRKNQLAHGILEPTPFRALIDNPGEKVIRTYADRSINREIDQVLSIIRSQNSGESFLEIETHGDKLLKYKFNKHKSERFHSIVSRREVGEPVIYVARVRQLDRDRLNGKVVNLENDKAVIVHFLHDKDFVKAHPYLGNNDDMIFIGAPVIEYGAFDPNAGDIYFIDLLG